MTTLGTWIATCKAPYTLRDDDNDDDNDDDGLHVSTEYPSNVSNVCLKVCIWILEGNSSVQGPTISRHRRPTAWPVVCYERLFGGSWVAMGEHFGGLDSVMPSGVEMVLLSQSLPS